MDDKEYLSTRVDEQIKWYDNKSIYYQKCYKRSQMIEIILASMIPFLAGIVGKVTWLSYIIALIGVVITVIESMNKLYKYHENWLQYRSTCELLRYQRFLYMTQSAPYNDIDESKFNFFVRSIEQIVSSENNQWKLLNAPQTEPGKEIERRK